LQQLFSRPRLKDFAAALEAGAAPAPAPTLRLDPAARHEPFPPTDVQRTYWLGRRADFALGGVGSQWYWEFDGQDVDLPRLERAWDRVVARHDMLRAVFDERGWQRVLHDVPPLSIPVETAAGPADAALGQLRASLSQRMADPSVWPLFEIRAVRYGSNRTRIGFSFDYIVLDALSIMLVFDELAALYADLDAGLPTTPLTFRDCVLARRHDSQSLEAARTYWDAQLPELPPAPQLPTVKDPSLVAGGQFRRREMRIDRTRWQTLVARARQHNLTSSSVLAAAFTEVLSAWSGRADMTLVFTLFDRDAAHPDVNRVVGDFTSLLSYRTVRRRRRPGSTPRGRCRSRRGRRCSIVRCRHSTWYATSRADRARRPRRCRLCSRARSASPTSWCGCRSRSAPMPAVCRRRLRSTWTIRWWRTTAS
jgi:hypothetical protein